MIPHRTLRLLIAALPLAAAAQAPATYVTDTPDGRSITIEFVTDNIVRVTNTPAGVEPEHTQAVLPLGGKPTLTVTELPGRRVVTSAAGVNAVVDGISGAVSIDAGAGRAIYDNGRRTTLPGGFTRTDIATMGHCSYYGAGERGHSFNLAGDTLVMYNRQNYGYTEGDPRIDQMNITMPLLVSSDGYALLFDDFHPATLIAGNPVQYITENDTPVSYYFIDGGASVASAVGHLTALTGRQPLPPLWSLGYITSKYGYRTERQTRDVVDSLRTAGYPLDGIVLDLYWYGKEEDMGRLAWDQEQWPDHRGMLSDLAAEGVNTVIISQPYLLRNGRGVDNYTQLAGSGMLMADSTGLAPQEVKIWVGEGGMFDMANTDTRRWLADRYRRLTDEGVGGWWGDLGEPEVHPQTGLHANGLTARQYHNVYGNDWSSIIRELYDSVYPDSRLMTMMRGGTTGLQRQSVFPWSTDVSRSWGGLQPQIKIMLNSGLSGLGYMSHDVGGFAIDPEHPYDPELYVRWLQLGLFSPMLRTHSQAYAEPYLYPDQQDIIVPLIRERYRWLPYNYTLAYENASAGMPLVRPLGFGRSDDSTAPYDDIHDQYMWGENVMVAPVLTPGTDSRRIIFPAGRWIDYNAPSHVYEDGDTIIYPAPLNVLPLFVRAGAFIPQADYAMDNTRQYRHDEFTVRYYPLPGVKSSYTLYDDDCTSTRSLQTDAYSLIKFTGTAGESTIVINVTAEGSYEGMPQKRNITFSIEGIGRKPRSVSVAGQRRAHWSYDAAARRITVTGTLTGRGPLSVVVTP